MTSAGPSSLLQLLIALSAVLAVGQVLGRLFTRIGQPAVIGEVVGGVLLGPSLLGRLSPELSNLLLPPSVGPALGYVAQLGAILYMFLVGVELEFDTLRTRARTTLAISFSGIAIPFALGLGLAWVMFPYGVGPSASASSYGFFLGVVLSITAFPVLARILADGGLQRSALGQLALTCAAVDDVAAWCLLALVAGIARANPWAAVSTLALTLVFIAAMLTLVRPAILRLARPGSDHLPAVTFAALMLAVLTAAATTEAIGIHAIFGAFLLGTLVPAESPLARGLTTRLHDIVTTVLLPAFFALTGLRMQLGLLAEPREWLLLALVVLVASCGKVGGIALAGRVSGQSWRTAVGLGILMNTRGLMQLIVLNLGLDLGIFDRALFTLLAVTALVTTMATAPALQVMGFWTDVRKRVGRVTGAA